MKIFGTLAGIFFISMILLMFWWLRWQDESQVHVDALVNNLTILERYWNATSRIQEGAFEIGYEEAVSTGFPFSMKVRLIKPFLRDTTGNKSFYINMPYVDFVPMENTSRSFRVEYPDFADAIYRFGETRTDYYLHLSQTPQLTLRKHQLRSAALNEYGITFPSSLVLTIDSKNKNFKLPMKFKVSGEPLWRPMFSDMRHQMKLFQDFLRRSMMGL